MKIDHDRAPKFPHTLPLLTPATQASISVAFITASAGEGCFGLLIGNWSLGCNCSFVTQEKHCTESRMHRLNINLLPQLKLTLVIFLIFPRLDALLRIPPPRSGDLYASLMVYLLGWCIVVI